MKVIYSALYTPRLVLIFSVQLFLYFLYYWQGTFVWESGASKIDDYFLPFYDPNNWFKGNLSGKIRTHSLVRVEGLKLSQTTLKKTRCMAGKCHANSSFHETALGKVGKSLPMRWSLTLAFLETFDVVINDVLKNAVPVHLLKKNYFSHILWLFRRIRELSNLEPLQNLQRLYLGMNRIQVSCLLKLLLN